MLLMMMMTQTSRCFSHGIQTLPSSGVEIQPSIRCENLEPDSTQNALFLSVPLSYSSAANKTGRLPVAGGELHRSGIQQLPVATQDSMLQLCDESKEA
jgi:hypothetical protein